MHRRQKSAKGINQRPAAVRSGFGIVTKARAKPKLDSRMLSYLTTMPRSARISSIAQARAEARREQNGVLNNFLPKTKATIRLRQWVSCSKSCRYSAGRINLRTSC
jgi:hypothetical protein